MSVIQFIKTNNHAKVAIVSTFSIVLLLLIILPFSIFLGVMVFLAFCTSITVAFATAMIAIEQYQEQKRLGGRK